MTTALMAFLLMIAAILSAIVPAETVPEEPTAAWGVRGWATWYDDGPGFYAAAGPALRRGDWRGTPVIVSANGRSVKVWLTDWCACGDRHGDPTVIDLSPDAFRVLAPLSQGIVRVEVSVGTESGGVEPRITLPPTDTGG
jgi:hypothetical protein